MLSLDTPVLAQCSCGGAGMVFGDEKRGDGKNGKEWLSAGDQSQLPGFRRNLP